MLKQYAILSICQIELQRVKLPAISKLRLEMQIIQAKIILLNGDVRAKVEGDGNSESEFTELYNQLTHLCTDCKPSVMTETIRLLSEINEDLEMHLLGTKASAGHEI